MPSALPLGDPAPFDGRLPESVLAGAKQRDFGVYIHVPYCRVRCGYCDFNTYTASELGGATQAGYAAEAACEISFAARVLGAARLPQRPVKTVFFGGGTPTLLPAADLVMLLRRVDEAWGLAPDAEVTVEANPDSVDRDYLAQLAAAGFTRISFGMQSAVPEVLRTLERTHDASRMPQLLAWAGSLGLATSVDLIYGAPGETLAAWQTSVAAVLALSPEHISAYALIVEEGTRLSRQIRRGELASPDDDLHAQMYELLDAQLSAAGYQWYEISNWSRSLATRSRHNLAYWLGHDWWGVGPGAHSHIGGVRWWNVKHPRAYAAKIAAGVSPAAGRETLSAADRHIERVLLETRIAEGLPLSALTATESAAIADLVAEGLVDAEAAAGRAGSAGRIVPTLRGRLLADILVHRLLR